MAPSSREAGSKNPPLEFVEMRELMPETWLREEEESTKNTIVWPKRHTVPVTDIFPVAPMFCCNGGGTIQDLPNHGTRVYELSGDNHQVCL